LPVKHRWHSIADLLERDPSAWLSFVRIRNAAP